MEITLFFIILLHLVGLIAIVILFSFYPSFPKLLFIIILLLFLLSYSAIIKESYIIKNKVDFSSRLKNIEIPAEEKILFTSDGIMLSVWEMKCGNYAPTIIFTHTAKSNKMQNFRLAKKLYKKGFNCILFDFRAHGESKGNIFTFGYKERKDLTTIIDYVLEKSYYKNKKIGLYGSSMGAFTCFLVGKNYREVEAIVANSCFSNVQNFLENYFKGKYNIPFWISKYPLKLAYLSRFLKNPSDISIRDDLGNLSGISKFFISGESNPENVTNLTRILYDKASGPKRLWIVSEEIDFNNQFRKSNDYMGKIVAFYNQFCKKRE